MISSAGWNTSRTRAGSRSPRSARARPAPSRADACTSCPQACATPATVLRHGSSVRSSTGSASRSRPEATTGPVSGPMSATSPVRWSGRVAMPASVEPLGDHAGGALLGPRQLGVGVQVAADVDHLGLEREGDASRSSAVNLPEGHRGVVSTLGGRPGPHLSAPGPPDALGAAHRPRRTPRESGRRQRRGEVAGEDRGPDLLADLLHPGRPPQPLLELVAHQRPGELELLVGALRLETVLPERLPVLEDPRPDVVDARVLQAGAGEHRWRPSPSSRVHQAQRAGELLGRGLAPRRRGRRRPCSPRSRRRSRGCPS